MAGLVPPSVSAADKSKPWTPGTSGAQTRFCPGMTMDGFAHNEKAPVETGALDV